MDKETEEIKIFIINKFTFYGLFCWRKVSFYTRPNGPSGINLVIVVNPKYEKMINEYLIKWRESQNWKMPIIVEAYDDNDIIHHILTKW
jgi:hypothetical protein